MKNTILLPLIMVMGLFATTDAQTDGIDVKHYEINLNVDNIIPKGHTGSTTITFDLLTDNYKKVQFDLLNQTVDSVYVGNLAVNTPFSKTEFAYDGKKVTFALPDWTSQTNNVAVVYYHGGSTVEKTSNAWGGLHYDKNIVYSMGVAFADYPHNYARSWFVCNDNFTDKASYDLYISVDNDREAVCSGKLIDTVRKENFTTWHYSLEQNVSPYLVAVTIAKFYTYTKTVHSQTYDYDIPLVVKYVYAKDSANVVHNFNKIEDAFNTLEQHFGRYAFNRLGYCVTPVGSMEHVDNISLAQGVITDTSMDAVSNIVHEMGHSWFGNLATCETAEDMWLNEGWTTYTTHLSLEAIYGKERTKDYWRKKHLWVLEKLPLAEGVLPVTPVDSSLTYSSTVYEKGSMVAKTIQGYFGDEKFFPAVKAMLEKFAFKSYNSEMMRDFFVEYTSDNDFASFFDNLVFQDNQINYDMYKDADGTCRFKFNHDVYTDKLHVPTIEKNGFTFADTEETLMTLNTDNQLNITSVGTYKMNESYCRIRVTQLQDSVFVRTTLHWTGPKYENLPYGVEKISSNHYWTLQGVDTNNAELQLQLYYQLSEEKNSFDNSLVADYDGRDSLVVLYRKDVNSPWIKVDCTDADDLKGYLTVDNPQNGDYCMAKADKKMLSLRQDDAMPYELHIYPNPSERSVNIICPKAEDMSVTVFDSKGMTIDEFKLNNHEAQYDFSSTGIYVLRFKSKDISFSKQVIIN